MRGGVSLDQETATDLARQLLDAAEDPHGGPIRDDDGVVRSPWLARDDQRLYTRGEPEVFFDLSDGLRTRTAEDATGGVTHHEAPVQRLKGWHETADGWVLVSTQGAGWRPEAFVPEGSR